MTQTQKSRALRHMTTSAVCLALCLVLPFLTGQIPQIGSALSPMHIPVLLCGFLCAPGWAAAVGFVAPLLRYVLFGIPPLYPVGIAMCFELAAYGAASSLLYRALPKKTGNLYASLILAMLIGRVVWGAARAIMSGVGSAAFTWQLFLAGAFTNAVSGIVLHILVIPPLVLALEKSRPAAG